MTIHAFKDDADGYYEVDIRDGASPPDWTKRLTACDVVPKDHEQTAETVINRAKVEFERRKKGGVKVGQKWFHTDADSRIQYIALKDMAKEHIAAGGSPSAVLQWSGQNISWRTLDNSYVNMTAQKALDVFDAVANLDFSAFATLEVHRAALSDPQTDPATYGYSSGWPTIFEV